MISEQDIQSLCSYLSQESGTPVQEDWAEHAKRAFRAMPYKDENKTLALHLKCVWWIFNTDTSTPGKFKGWGAVTHNMKNYADWLEKGALKRQFLEYMKAKAIAKKSAPQVVAEKAKISDLIKTDAVGPFQFAMQWNKCTEKWTANDFRRAILYRSYVENNPWWRTKIVESEILARADEFCAIPITWSLAYDGIGYYGCRKCFGTNQRRVYENDRVVGFADCVCVRFVPRLPFITTLVGEYNDSNPNSGKGQQKRKLLYEALSQYFIEDSFFQ